ncbi:MAG: hypothetical protein H6Q59_2912 [Firmicutes bacterium]|nr:hypothetical protein [Bacillota bacterium]
MSSFKQLPLFSQIILLTLISIIVFTGFFNFYTQNTEKQYKNRSTDYTNKIIYQTELTINSNYSSLTKILQFISYHDDIQSFLLEQNNEKKYKYYKKMNTNLASIMMLNNHIYDVIIYDNDENEYSLSDNDYTLPKYFNTFDSVGLSSCLYNADLDHYYFVMHYPIKSINANKNANQKIGDAYLILSDTAFLDQANQNFNKTSSILYLMDSNNQIFWSNTSKDFSSLSDLKASGYRDYKITTIKECGLKIISLTKQEEEIYSLINIQRSYLTILILVAIIIFSLWIVLIINTVAPLYTFVRFISSIKEGDLSTLKKRVHLEGYKEIAIISKETNEMLEQIDDLTNTVLNTNSKLYKIEIQKQQANLSYLRSQINPHFLYNTLECIKGIAAEHKQPEIVEAAKALATIFKYSIKGSDQVPFRDEIKIIKNYISIQKLRFEDRFYVEYDIHPNCYDVIIPKMILQPIVENAIIHGIEGTRDTSRLFIFAYLTKDQMIIRVNNTGVPIALERLQQLQKDLTDFSELNDFTESPVQISRESLGIKNVNERIKLICGDSFGLTINSMEDGSTTVTIALPLNVNPESSE